MNPKFRFTFKVDDLFFMTYKTLDEIIPLKYKLDEIEKDISSNPIFEHTYDYSKCKIYKDISSGRFDKNNVEIFSGDIIRYQNEIGIVEWCEQICMLSIIKPNTNEVCLWGIWWRNSDEYEVIGNIHQDKDYLTYFDKIEWKFNDK